MGVLEGSQLVVLNLPGVGGLWARDDTGLYPAVKVFPPPRHRVIPGVGGVSSATTQGHPLSWRCFVRHDTGSSPELKVFRPPRMGIVQCTKGGGARACGVFKWYKGGWIPRLKPRSAQLPSLVPVPKPILQQGPIGFVQIFGRGKPCHDPMLKLSVKRTVES